MGKRILWHLKAVTRCHSFSPSVLKACMLVTCLNVLKHEVNSTGSNPVYSTVNHSFVVTCKHFCFIFSMGTWILIDSVMRPQSSSTGRNTSDSVTVTAQANKRN